MLMSNASPLLHDRVARTEGISEAFRLEYAALVWMTVDAAVGVGSDVAASGLLLIACGINNVIELCSVGVLHRRLNFEPRRAEVLAEDTERAAARIGAMLPFALARYVVK